MVEHQRFQRSFGLHGDAAAPGSCMLVSKLAIRAVASSMSRQVYWRKLAPSRCRRRQSPSYPGWRKGRAQRGERLSLFIGHRRLLSPDQFF